MYRYRKPTTAEFAAYWNANVESNGKPNISAQANLAIAVRESPDEKTFADLLEAEWSSLPAKIHGLILGAAGLFPFAKKRDDDNGERLDVGRCLSAEVCIAGDSNKSTDEDERLAAHMTAMRQLGMNDVVLNQWLGNRNPNATRVFVALPSSIGGYYVGKVPSLSDRITAQRIQNAPSSDPESGAFDALCKLFLDCCLWCVPMTPAQMIEQWPGAVVSIALAVRDLGADSFVIEQKKSSP